MLALPLPRCAMMRMSGDFLSTSGRTWPRLVKRSTMASLILSAPYWVLRMAGLVPVKSTAMVAVPGKCSSQGMVWAPR
ncbi:hypothetical protein D3C75_865610 [compost metagenome]